jgi:hypothetical protein
MALSSIYTNNTSTPAPQATVGFKISKPGYNALTTSGSNMVFDSSWPSLPIAYETTLTNAFPSTVTHNLKFPPFAAVWAYGTDASGKTGANRFFFPVDTTTLYLDTSALSIPQLAFWNAATKIKVRCFQLDLSTDIDYTLAPGDTYNQPYDPNFGVKVVKAGKNINSTDLRDYALHSRAQSPLILAVKTKATSTNGSNKVIQYTSKLSYPCWVYGYVKQASGKYQPAPYYAQAYPITKTDGTLSYIQYSGTDTDATIVILRDPMFAATATTIQY